MCTFCGCTKRITKNHEVELPYIQALLKELSMYVELLGEKPVIQQLHLGGGTPTFFSPENLRTLMEGIFRRARRAEKVEYSFEGHPNNTTAEHLEVLAEFGFDRVCYGVQDYNPKVQRAIRRMQPFENVKAATRTARELGYNSVGHDLIYGLPFQTQEDVIESIAKTIALMPDRIAFYSYAHVPWMKGNGQRGFNEEDLPTPQQKKLQYEIGKELLLKAGYLEIGMDHFALPTDSLAKAHSEGKLHRNFMGYATQPTQLMIGLGASAIGDSWYGFAQNVKQVEAYQDLVSSGVLPLHRGHLLTDEDLVVRKHILNLMCRFKTSWEDPDMMLPELDDILPKLNELERDGLICIEENQLRVTEKGRPFVRNVCLPFDLRLQRKRPQTQLFSMTV